jgi:hypothetical protein
MILKASQRGGAIDLARHLLKDENEHVTVHDVRGFASETITEAFKEAYAVSKGTKCKQFLFSLSLNPPQEAYVGEDDFKAAISEVEDRLGLKDQPRAIVFHEKEGRRHAHVVWSRIKADSMTAVNMSHFKTKLNRLSRELYLKHGWDLPDGFRDPSLRDPLNFTLAEWQEAARHNRDPRELKQLFQKSWERSDGGKAFGSILKEHGFILARGDRRGFVAVDYLGGVYSLSKYAGVRAKALKTRLGDPESLLSVDEAKETIRKATKPALKAQLNEKHERHVEIAAHFKREAKEMASAHKEQRSCLAQAHQTRTSHEQGQRQARYNEGLAAVWDALTGKKKFLKKQNELEAWQCAKRDQSERDALIFEQINERQSLQHRINNARADYRYDRKALGRQIGAILSIDREAMILWHQQQIERDRAHDASDRESEDELDRRWNYDRDGPSFG